MRAPSSFGASFCILVGLALGCASEPPPPEPTPPPRDEPAPVAGEPVCCLVRTSPRAAYSYRDASECEVYDRAESARACDVVCCSRPDGRLTHEMRAECEPLEPGARVLTDAECTAETRHVCCMEGGAPADYEIVDPTTMSDGACGAVFDQTEMRNCSPACCRIDDHGKVRFQTIPRGECVASSAVGPSRDRIEDGCRQ